MLHDLFTHPVFYRPNVTAPDHILRLTTPTPVFCAVCRRKSGSTGYAPIGFPTLWMCTDPDCQEIITSKRLFFMSTPDFNEIEQAAVFEAGRAGFAYLKSAGTTDLKKLQPHQALEFIERIVDGFGAHLRARLTAPDRSANGQA